LGLVEFQPSLLALPAVVGLGTEVVLPADLLVAQFRGFGLPQDADDLFGRVVCSLHRWFPFFSPKTISSSMAYFSGAQSIFATLHGKAGCACHNVQDMLTLTWMQRKLFL